MPAPHGLRPLRLLPSETVDKAQLLEAKDNLQHMLAARRIGARYRRCCRPPFQEQR
jgi:hypothetical protein